MSDLFNPNTPLFSVYGPGYFNKKNKAVPATYPMGTATLYGVYHYITGNEAKEATEKLHLITDHYQLQEQKALTLRTASPAGVFRYRNAKSLVEHSGLMVIDIDDIASHCRLMQMRDLLINDRVFETELLFISPSGKGLKWIIYVGDMQGLSHKEFFYKVRNYLLDTYGIEADKSGNDVCRICYLPYDPECYINPELLR